MPVALLDAKAAPKGAALWLEMIQQQGRALNPGPPSGRLYGRLTGAGLFILRWRRFSTCEITQDAILCHQNCGAHCIGFKHSMNNPG